MNQKKILIVDDEPEMIELLSARLEANHYNVCSASDGMEGIQVAQKEKPDLIILDVLMPNLDGRGFVTEIKKIIEIKETPIIILSASNEAQGMFQEGDIQYYIVKPFTPDELLMKINQIWAGEANIEYN